MSRLSSSALKESSKVWSLVLLVVAVGFVITYQFVEPPPPDTVRIATGDKAGAYYAFAQKYAAILARDGITLEVVPTAGSLENLELLKKGEVSIALVQGGSASAADAEEIQSLGSMFLESVWVFTLARKSLQRLADLKGKSIAVGAPGSGTYLLALELLRAAGVEEPNASLVRADTKKSVELITRGEVEAAFFVASPSSPTIRALMQERRLALFSFTRAAAYAHLFPYLTAVTLHEGVMDLARNIPARDTALVAAAANLVARQDLNSNLVPALMNAVMEVHQPSGVLEKKRQFPSVDFVDLPLKQEARHYIVNGPSFFYRWLPYTAAVYLDRLKILLLPFIVLMIPLFRFAPQLYRWRIRYKIYHWYATVREIDSMVREERFDGPVEPVVKRLRDLEREVAAVSVPLSYTGELYDLRVHIRLVADRIASLRQPPAET